MTAPEDRDIDALAAEYALGTLDADERAEAAARRQREPYLDAAIVDWERRLAPLLDNVDAAAPPEDLFQRIEARIAGAASPAATPIAPSMPPTPILTAGDDPRRARSGGAQGEVVRLRRRVAAWRTLAVAASVALAALVGVLVYRPAFVVRQPDQRYVAVFQDDDKAPRFVMSVDLASRQVTIRPIDAAPAPANVYQLWIVAEELGEGPQSLGLLDGVDRPTRKTLAHVTPAALEGALFGISLEPPGGSPTGKPTGPALHGALIPMSTGGE